MNKNWLNGKTVIVTGASSGIGRGLTKALIREHGCTVFGIARNQDKMEALITELGEDAGRFSYRLFDISEQGNWGKYASYLRENNIKPDLLINNAGVLPKFNRFSAYSVEEIEAAVKINFFGAVYACHALLPLLLESPAPAIVNIDSAAALMSLAGTTAYSASKAALKAFTEALREELRGRCYVGLVCPGFTKTDIFRDQNTGDEKQQKLIGMVSSSCDGMVKKIMKGIVKQRSLMVFGADAQCMKHFGRWMPVQGGRLFSWVLKKSKLPLFGGVFADD